MVNLYDTPVCLSCSYSTLISVLTNLASQMLGLQGPKGWTVEPAVFRPKDGRNGLTRAKMLVREAYPSNAIGPLPSLHNLDRRTLSNIASLGSLVQMPSHRLAITIIEVADDPFLR